ncbi:MAG: metallophosphoesterase family protein [Halanaerobiales bacterium]
MSDYLKFLHTGDIHLGRPLNCGSEVPEYLESVFNDAGYKSLEIMFDIALERKVDFVLITGDLFDSEARSVKASRIFVEQSRRLEKNNIPVYIISGNHDPGGGIDEPFPFPDNVYFFDSEDVNMIKYKDEHENLLARIIGQSYRSKFESRKMYTYYTVPDTNCFNLGMLHTQLNPDNNRYVPISSSDLITKDDIHYWALGHIHESRILRASPPVLVYSGTPQGHNISERGKKGCFIIEASPYNPDEIPLIKFIPVSPVIFKKIDINIEEKEELPPRNISDLQDMLIQEAENLLDNPDGEKINFPGLENKNVLIEEKYEPVKGFIVRWLIKGRGPLHEIIEKNTEETENELKNILNNHFAAQDMDPFIWTHSLVFRTSRNLPSIEELKYNEIYQEIESVIEDIKNKEEPEEKMLDNWGRIWEGSQEPEERENDKFFPDRETKDEILKAAHQKIIARLFSRGDEK